VPNIVSGTINIIGRQFYGPPADGTITYQLVIWGAGASPLLGPVTSQVWPVPAGQNLFEWANFDTTTLADGTYIVYPRILDATGQVAYGLQPQSATMVVANHPPVSTGPQVIPVAPFSSEKGSSPRADFIAYDGVPNPTHNTYPVPYAVVIGANNPASPYHNDPTPLRNIGNYYWENQAGPHTGEYYGTPEWVTTKSGGVYANYINSLLSGDTPGSYPGAVKQNVMAGTRLNSIISPFSNYVEDPTTAGKWWGVEISGRVFWLDQHGNVTVVAGFTRDRTQLTYDPGDPNVTPDDVETTKTTFVGNFPPDVDFGGGNDLCFDPRDPNWLYVVAQVDNWIGAIHLSTNPVTVTVFAGTPNAPDGYTGDEGAATSATFASPSSIIMDASGNMYVCDSYNSAIRKITSPAPGTSGTITTLCGGSVGPTPPDATTFSAANGPFAVSSITWSGATVYGSGAPGSGTVVMSVPIPNIKAGWSLDLSGATNVGGAGDPNARYTVIAVTDTSHFTVISGPAFPAGSGPNSIGMIGGSPAFTAYNRDVYSPPGTVGFANAYVTFPNSIRFTSQGNIVVSEPPTSTMRLIDLSTHTITRIGSFGNYLPVGATSNLTGWMWHDVDSVGTCGPVDDIIVAIFNDGLFSAHRGWRMSLQASSIPGIPAYAATFFNDGYVLPTYGQLVSGAHYGWAASISRLEGRMIFTGTADFFPTTIRIQQPTDPIVNFGTNFDQNAYGRGFGIHNQGTCNGFPWESRPAFWSVWGPQGVPWINNRSGPNTFEDLMQGIYASTTPGDAGDVALAAFIQSGMGGVVPRPEMTGNDLRDYIYYIRRQTLQGSIGMNVGGVNIPVAPGPDNPDNVAPLILTFSATRTDATTVRFDWTTDKSTIGLACCGSATQALTYSYYPMFSEIESGFGTSHSATMTVPPGISPLHCTVVVKDLAGNFSHAKDVVLGAFGPTPDGTSIYSGTGGALVTKYGVWTFGDAVEPPPAYNQGGGSQSRVLLNGKPVAILFTQGAQRMEVNYGGNLYAVFGGSDQLWSGWFGYDWGDAGSPNLTGGSPPPLPNYNPPYTPSPDGSTISGGVGTLTTSDGNWSFGAASGAGWNVTLNGIVVGGFGPIITLEVNAFGVLYMQAFDTTWYTWVGNQPQHATSPQSGPVPIDVRFSPPNPQVPISTPPGTVVCTATVTTSDGSPFTGTLVVGGQPALGASFISGVWSVVTTALPLGGVNEAGVEVTQNGSTYTTVLDVNAS
jgi:hypothetical protein